MAKRGPPRQKFDKKKPYKNTKSFFSVRKTPIGKKRKTLAGLLLEIEKNSDDIDKLKKPDELWAFEFVTPFGNRHSYETYENVDLLVNALRRYKSLEGSMHKRDSDLPDNIKLIKFKGSSVDWTKRKKAEVAERKKKLAAKKEKERKRLFQTRKERKQYKQKAEKLASENRKLKNQLKKSKRKKK